MRNEIDFIIVAFAFFLGGALGYMIGTPDLGKQPIRPSYQTPITDTLPNMGQE